MPRLGLALGVALAGFGLAGSDDKAKCANSCDCQCSGSMNSPPIIGAASKLGASLLDRQPEGTLPAQRPDLVELNPPAHPSSTTLLGALPWQGCKIYTSAAQKASWMDLPDAKACWEKCAPTPASRNDYVCGWRKNSQDAWTCSYYDLSNTTSLDKIVAFLPGPTRDAHVLAAGATSVEALTAATCFQNAPAGSADAGDGGLLAENCQHLATTTVALQKQAGVGTPFQRTLLAIEKSAPLCSVPGWKSLIDLGPDATGGGPFECTSDEDCGSATPAAWDLQCVSAVASSKKGYCGHTAKHQKCDSDKGCNPDDVSPEYWQYACRGDGVEKGCDFAPLGYVKLAINKIRCESPPENDTLGIAGHFEDGVCKCPEDTASTVHGLNSAPPFDVDWANPFLPGKGIYLGASSSQSSCAKTGLSAAAGKEGDPPTHDFCNGIPMPTHTYGYCQNVTPTVGFFAEDLKPGDTSKECLEIRGGTSCANVLSFRCRDASNSPLSGCKKENPPPAAQWWRCDRFSSEAASGCVRCDGSSDCPYASERACQVATACEARWLLTCAGDAQDGGRCSRCRYGNDHSGTLQLDCEKSSQSFGNFGGAKFDKSWRWGDKTPHGPYKRNASDINQGWAEMFFRSRQDCEVAKKEVNSKKAHKWGSGVACWHDEECHSGYCWATGENCGAGTAPGGSQWPHPGVCAPVASRKYNNVEHWTGGSANVGCPLKSQRDEDGLWYAVPQDTGFDDKRWLQQGISWCYDGESIYTTPDSGPGSEGNCLTTPGSAYEMKELCGVPKPAAA